MEQLLTPKQTASYLQVKVEIIWRYIRNGRLKAHTIGGGSGKPYRIFKKDLVNLLKEK